MDTVDIEAAVERLIDDAEQQGFCRTVTDPGALATIANIVRPAIVCAEPARRKRNAAATTSAALEEGRTSALATPE